MAQVALYRAWRPLDFTSVVGQPQVVGPLRQAVLNGESAHAYLFCGTRGTGKTSMAKILARAVNCLQAQDGNPCNRCEICQGILDGTLLDVQEIDAASNNSVDNVRRIIDEIVFLPVKAKYKVYIVDEVHMLSTGAFNALLKTLEEPPAHAIFILATTEPQRLPATILSRCQRYDFRRIPNEEIIARLRQIAASEKIKITPDALAHVAVLADGALRDAISLLDQCKLSFPEGTELPDLLELLGSVDKVFAATLARALIQGQAAQLLALVAELVAQGQDIARFSLELSGFFRDVLVMKQAPESQGLVDGSAEEIHEIRLLSEVYSVAELMYCIKEMSAMVSELKYSVQPRISLEVCLLKLLATLQQSRKAAPASPQTAAPPQSAPPQTAAAEAVTTAVAKCSASQANTLPAAQAVTAQTALAQGASAKATLAALSPVVEKENPVASGVDEQRSGADRMPAAEPAATAELAPPVREIASPPLERGGSPLATLSAEDLALLPPAVIAEAKAQARQKQRAELAAAPVTEDSASKQASAALPDAELLLQRWQETLHILKSEDRYLQLFAKDAEAQATERGLELRFYKATEANYNVLSGKEARPLFNIWKRLWAPLEVPLLLIPPTQEGGPPAEAIAPHSPNHWLEQLRQAAAELDINFEEER